MDTKQLLEWAEERHLYYCQIGSEFLRKNEHPIIYPAFILVCNKTYTAGMARSGQNKCEYNLPFLLEEQVIYEQTIAHEVAHIVADKMYHGKSHGDLFKYVLSHVFHRLALRHHNYKRPSLKSYMLAEFILAARMKRVIETCAAETREL